MNANNPPAKSIAAFWSAVEDEILRVHAGVDHISDIAARLGRSRSSVENRCNRLGLKRERVRVRMAQFDLDADLKRRFFVLFNESSSGCFDWSGSINEKGYGKIPTTRNGRSVNVKAHRLAWEYANGRSVPAGLVVMHFCDNRRCVNPDHLTVGTQADNVADAVKKGHMRGSPKKAPGVSARLVRAEERRRG